MEFISVFLIIYQGHDEGQGHGEGQGHSESQGESQSGRQG